MADEPESVIRAENFFDILSMAVSYAEGKQVRGLEPFLRRSVKGKDQVRSDRMERRPSKIVSNEVRDHIERAQKVLDAHDENRFNQDTEEIPIQANTVTPEDASNVDGKIVKEVPANKKVASNTDLAKLIKDREEGRKEDEVSHKKEMPGNMHTEIYKIFDGVSPVKEASLGEEDDELKNLYN